MTSCKHLNTLLHQYVFQVQVRTSSEPELNLVELVQVGSVQVQVQEK